MIADRINQIGVSPTMKIAAKAKMMKSEGIDVVDFSVGEPDFPTPENIKQAAIKAIHENKTTYTINDGLVDLRKAIQKKLKEDNGLHYELNQIIVSNGAKQSLYNVIMSIVDEGEEVIIPAPFWVSYPEMVNLAKGKPVFINTKEENGFKLTPEELKEAISPSTKALILCNPSNPTGAAYTKEELLALAEVVEKEDLYVISDEIYEKLTYDDFKFISFASLSLKLKEKTIVINGVSKAYAMTGWRIGYAAGPKEIIEGCSKIQSHSTSNAGSISQYASLEALNGSQEELPKMLAEFKKRRDYVLKELSKIPGVSCNKPEGAFYIFPNVSAYFGKEFNGTFIRNSYGLAYYLLKEAKVALVPGDAFGDDNFIRISYATSMQNLEKGMARIKEALNKLHTPSRAMVMRLNNTITKIKKTITVESSITEEKSLQYIKDSESHLINENYFEWNAYINGVIIQLKTNVPHFYDFWVENWYPAQLGNDVQPHGVIYAIEGIVGKDPHAYYNSETKTGFLFNTDNYGSLRSLTLGVVMDIAESVLGLHAVRGMSADYKGKGFVLIGSKGTSKTQIFYGLLNINSVALNSSDLLLVKYNGGGNPVADNPERKIYIPTNTAGVIPQLSELFERSKCENVIGKSEECSTKECQFSSQCLLDMGYPYCFKGSSDSYAMLDPYWIGGMYKYVRRSKLNYAFVILNNANSPLIEELQKEEAIKILEAGFPPEHSHEKTVPFYNTHLILPTDERVALQKTNYERFFSAVKVYGINVSKGSVEEVREAIVNKLEE